jgi:hypothetical protein
MVDETPDSGPQGGAMTPQPHAPEEARAVDALGAQAPLDGSVVHVDFSAGRGRGGDLSGQTLPGPPPPQEGAAAPESGDGGGGPEKPGKPEPKKGKTIDWGKFNHLCENFVLIYGTDTVWDDSERLIMKISNMGHAHGSEMVRLWKSSERRRTVRQENVVFDPTMTADPETSVNLFDGIKLRPEKGDVEPMLQLIRFLTSKTHEHEEGCDDIMHWLLCWLAYPLQNPGAKLRTSVIMHGDEGAGKNFLFDTVVAIYGKYGVVVGQDELEDRFNDWRSCKLFVVGDEVSSRAELVHNKNRLKALITSETVQINPKNLPRREETNQMNVAFLSNELQPLALDNSDRRYLVVYTPRARERDFYQKLRAWRDEGGIAAFYEYLLNYPLADFDPYAPAPMTGAKQNLIELNRKSPELFWNEWAGGELDLPYMACSISQAYQAYMKWCQRTGDRYPFKQGQFTPTMLRFAESQGRSPYPRVKAMNVEQPGGGKKTTRMYLVAEPVLQQQEGDNRMTEGEWATSCVADFGECLRRYLGYGSGSPAPDGSHHGGEGGE